MICHTCSHYIPMGQQSPISPICTWRPTAEEMAILAAILPAPRLSRVNVAPAMTSVEQCARWTA